MRFGLWREGTFGIELAALLRDPLWRGEGVAPGDGMPVLLVPGFLVGDRSLWPLRDWLGRIGYAPQVSGIRHNVACSAALVRRLERRLEGMAREHRSRVALVGHSRGGSLAKVLAQRNPHLVAGVVMLGTPQIEPLAVDPVVRALLFATGTLGTLGVPGFASASCLIGSCCREFWRLYGEPIDRRVPLVSVYSRRDGIVDWRSCLDPSATHVEVASTHMGMVASVPAFRVLAATLRDFAANRRRLERIPRPGALGEGIKIPPRPRARQHRARAPRGVARAPR